MGYKTFVGRGVVGRMCPSGEMACTTHAKQQLRAALVDCLFFVSYAYHLEILRNVDARKKLSNKRL